MTYTLTRITVEYLAKLQALARTNKRSATKQLEVLIDQSSTTQPEPDSKDGEA